MKLFIFGSTGDLARGKIIPAFNYLEKNNLEIYALGRKGFNDEDYKNYVCKEDCSEKFKKKIHYIFVDYNLEDFCQFCLNSLDKEKINYFYVAFPPNLYEKILISLGKMKQIGFKIKILIEKPFGENFESSNQLKKIVKKWDLEKDLFLSDHYLFKKNVLKLKKQNFENIQIISIEKIGLEGRNSFYENVGVLKDMVQSHLFNILFKIMPDKNSLEKSVIKKFVFGVCRNPGTFLKTPTFVYVELEVKKKKIVFVSGKFMDKKESLIKIDGAPFSMGAGNSYVDLFNEFFMGKKRNFPKIDDTIFSWKLIEKFEKKKPEFVYYDAGSKIENILKLAKN